MRNGAKYWDTGITLVQGCTKVSPACDNCWALSMESRHKKDSTPKFMPERLERFKKNLGIVSIWNDLFHPVVTVQQQRQTMDAIESSPHNQYLILTKRSKEMVQFYRCPEGTQSNTWNGVTIETMDYLDRLCILMLPGKHILSVEPMLGAIVLPKERLDDIHWVLCGPENYAKIKRPFNPSWAKNLYEQCASAGVPFFWKGKEGFLPREYPKELSLTNNNGVINSGNTR